MITVSRPYIGAKEYINVFRVLASGNLSAGKFVRQFESAFAKKFQTQYVAAVSNGTTALHLALLGAGVGPGDEVITTPFTFIATANSILMTGATPVFVDIDPNTFCLSPEKVKDFVTEKTKAVLAVNLYGMPCDYDEIKKCIPKSTVIIEDAAQSVGAKYKGKYSGCLGDVAAFSLYATKNLTSGEGGVVTSENAAIMKKIKMLRQHGMSESGSYKYEMMGYNYRMTDVAASIVTAQLSRIDFINSKRKKIVERYSAGLSDVLGIEVISSQKDFESSFHQYPIRVTSNAKISRDDLKTKLFKLGIGTAIYYPDVLYKINHLKTRSIYLECPNAETAAKEVLCLPIYPGLAEDDQWYIIDSINQLLR